MSSATTALIRSVDVSMVRSNSPDSIEATFVRPIQVQGKHLFRFGTVKGRLVVEPFVAGSFLLGLYRLEDAVLETSS